MGDVKPWQVVVIVAALVITAGGIVYAIATPGNAPKLADQLVLADVGTGELWVASVKGRGIALPAVNPDTGKQSLVVVVQSEDGKWSASPRDVQVVAKLGVPTSAVDTRTGEFKVTTDEPRKLR